MWSAVSHEGNWRWRMLALTRELLNREHTGIKNRMR